MGTYDPGSQVSLINSKWIKIKENTEDVNRIFLKSVNGVNHTNGLIRIRIKIFNIEKEVEVYIVEREDFEDFIIGLDLIPIFKLRLNENLEISQKVDEKIEEPKIILREIKSKTMNCSVNFNEHVETDEFRIKIEHLDKEKKVKIERLIDNNKSVFAKDKYDVGTVNEYEARIDLIVEKYCSKRPYRCNIKDKEEIEKQIAKLLEKNMIEESYSPFAAPVTLAYKKNEGKTRMCIDFRDLNKNIVPQAQPFPLIDDIIIRARNCKYFTTLDINSAFWSIPLRIEDRRKTGFVTQDGHFQWTCLPFGLKTAPAIFQRILSNILRKHGLMEFSVNYIDDILIHSPTFKKHLDHIEKVLDAIKKEGFRLKFKKCTFAASSVRYLGHIIGENTVTPLKDNIISIKNFPTPTTQKQIRQFLGKINFYHEYIEKSSILLDPLHKLLRKNVKFIWTEECEESFRKIKEKLCDQPVLEIFDKDLPIKIYTDASLEGIGAILKQIQEDGKEKPVAYFSKKLNETQKRKKAIYLECLAIKEAIKYWQHWLIGRYFEVHSDHKPLENMNIRARTDEELGDLTYYLSQYDFKVIYVPGKDNTEADCLSRNPVLESNIEEEEDLLKTVNLIEIDEIKLDQINNVSLINKTERLIKRNGIYYKKVKRREKIILSEKFSIDLIKRTHKEWCHTGVTQTRIKICPYYTAKNLTENIKKVCKECEICLKNKSRGQHRFGSMSQLGPATRAFEIMSIDTIGGFGSTRSTKKYIHLLVDHFTRYAFISTSKTQNANDFIKLVQTVLEIEKIRTILTDQYPGLNSGEFKDYLKEEKVQLIFTAINSPFSNGLNERLNQTLINKIRCRINEEEKKRAWTSIARECVNKYNRLEHTITGFTPEYLLHGTDTSNIPEELKRRKNGEDWIRDKKLALERTLRSHNYNKSIFDKNRRHHEFNVGDRVFIENGNKLNRKKLEELRIGPFTIEEKISDSIYKIKTGRRNQDTTLFHVTKLLPMIDNESD